MVSPAIFRRRRRAGAVAGVDEIAYLRANISGGDASIPAMYSTAYNVTLNASAVSAWDDARGTSSFGPQLAQATAGAQPAWDAVNLLITPDGVNDFLASAAIAAFDSSQALTLAVVAAFPSATSSYAVSINSAGSRLLSAQHTSTINGRVSGTGIGSTVSAGASRRLLITSKNASTTGTAQVPSVAAQSATVTNNATGNNTMHVGQLGNGTLWSNASIRAIVVLARQATAGDVTALTTWATTYHAAVLA